MKLPRPVFRIVEDMSDPLPSFDNFAICDDCNILRICKFPFKHNDS